MSAHKIITLKAEIAVYEKDLIDPAKAHWSGATRRMTTELIQMKQQEIERLTAR